MLTILPSSNADAIIATLTAAPANSLAIPVTENTAAHNATKVAVNDVTAINEDRVFIVYLRKRD